MSGSTAAILRCSSFVAQMKSIAGSEAPAAWVIRYSTPSPRTTLRSSSSRSCGSTYAASPGSIGYSVPEPARAVEPVAWTLTSAAEISIGVNCFSAV